MSNALSIIGRVAQLCNLVAKPELNGSYVIVESFDSEKERYGVRTLVPPNAVNAVAQLLSVKVTSLQFREEAMFASRFPEASVVTVAMGMNDIAPGTICDFSQCPPISDMVPLIFGKSCLCRGAPSTLSSTGEARPTTVIQNDVRVKFPDDGIVEFEDINFDNSLEGGGFDVYKIKQIAFRRCRFRGASCGIAVGSNKKGCRATFENCLFENTPNCGVAVFENATVTMINCVFRAPGICARVDEGGRFTAIHCTFNGPVHALEKVPSLELINCTIVNAPSNGVTIGNATTARLVGCRVMRCAGEGIVIKGPKRCTVSIEDCVVTECNMGYLCEMGKLDVTLRNSHAFNNVFHGLHLGATINGSVTVNNCTFRDNRGCMDVVKMCGQECPVTIDGVLQPLAFDMVTFERVMGDMQRLANADFEKNGACRVSLEKRRATKKVNVENAGDVCCLNCNTPEPIGVKFRICAKCKEVVYCSRECQVAHWKEHKKECGKVEYG